MGSATEPDTPDRALSAIQRISDIAIAQEQLPATILEMNLQLIMISWFRKYPMVKKTLVPFQEAIEICENRFPENSRKIA